MAPEIEAREIRTTFVQHLPGAARRYRHYLPLFPAAAATLESELGIAVTGGGRHPGAGSWNRIAWLADASYLELIGIDDPELASKSPVNAAASSLLRRRARTCANSCRTPTVVVASIRCSRTPSTIRRHGSRNGCCAPTA